MQDQLMFTSILFLIISTLYSSIGHAGASGYLAIMALLSFAPETIKPTSLVLNIIVAAIASFRFIKAGYFDRKIFLIFISTSIPMAYLGGHLNLPSEIFKLVAGIFLILSSIMLLFKQYIKTQNFELKKVSLIPGIILGAIIGIFSGLIGVGGGIFLSPILILAKWADVKKAAGISALFILLNSISALAGHYTTMNHINKNIYLWGITVVIGAIIGTYFGIKKFNNKIITTFLFIVLFSAGLKFIVIDYLK